MLPDEGKISDLVKCSIEKSSQDLSSAKILFNSNDFLGANNRAYYSIYHAISAV